MPKIFISYRRSDTQAISGRIHDHLADAFGAKNVFIDFDNIPPGVDFREFIAQEMETCDVLLVVMGNQWSSVKDDDGARRLLNPADPVRIEVETGLQREQISLIPILINNTRMPKPDTLPDSLEPLAYLNAMQIRDGRDFRRDMERVIDTIRKMPRRNTTRTGMRLSTEASNQGRLIGIALAVVALLILGGVFVLGVFGGDQSDETPQETEVAANVETEESIATDTEVPTDEPTATNTPTDEPTATNTPTDEPTATNTPTDEPTATNTPTDEPTATNTPTDEPTVTHTPKPPTMTPTLSPLDLAQVGVDRNDDWEPYIQEFNGVEMVLVPAGSFTMGSTEEEIEFGYQMCEAAAVESAQCSRSWVEDEAPTSQQEMAAFWIDRTEVTRAQYQACVDVGECERTPDSDFSSEPDQPINRVTWFQARDYCTWRGASLPTEREWEYAARGPDGLLFPWGDEFEGNEANHCDGNCGQQDWASVYNYVNEENDDGYAITAPVGSYPQDASWVGALDMSGNVWEWTRSVFTEYSYVADDGREMDQGEETDVLYSLRGGSFYITSFFLRAANRDRNDPNYVNGNNGFRCARSFG